MRKAIFLLMTISLIVSLIFNVNQYRTLNVYRQKQHLNDEEMIATIRRFSFYLDTTDIKTVEEDNARDCSSMSERIFILARNSNHSNNNDVMNCFQDLNNLFTGLPVSKIKNVYNQIKVLLKLTISTNNDGINIDGCKNLSKFIRNNM